MKRFISVLLALALLLSFTACGKKDIDTEDTTAESVVGTVTNDNGTEASVDTPSEQEETSAETTTKKNDTVTTTNAPAVAEKGVSKKTFEGSVTQIVYYPNAMKSNGKTYPVLSWANGTMCPPDMYDGLLTLIAEGGYIVIACSDTMPANSNSQIDSIDFMLKQNSDSSSIFYKKIDTNKIGVIGHSQGGRASVNSAAKDSRIDCVLSLAGSNYDYEAEKLSTPTFFMTGTADAIVSSSQWVKPAYDICKGPAVYASLDGAVHTTCCTNPEKYSYYAIKWFDAWLKNDANAKKIFSNGGALSNDSAWVDFECKDI